MDGIIDRLEDFESLDDDDMKIGELCFSAAQRIIDLEKSLAYAIEVAGDWYDDSTGRGKCNTPEMDKARALLDRFSL